MGKVQRNLLRRGGNNKGRMKEKSPADTLKLGECEASEKEDINKTKND